MRGGIVAQSFSPWVVLVASISALAVSILLTKRQQIKKTTKKDKDSNKPAPTTPSTTTTTTSTNLPSHVTIQSSERLIVKHSFASIAKQNNLKKPLNIIQLSRLDRVMSPQFFLPLLFFFENQVPIPLMKSALEETLRTFPSLAGRLMINPETSHADYKNGKEDFVGGGGGEFCVKMGENGNIGSCHLEIAITTLHLKEDVLDHIKPSSLSEITVLHEFGKLNTSSDISWLYPQFSNQIQDYLKKNDPHPLLTIRLTYFAKGGMCIGIVFPHAVVDAASLFHFMKGWGKEVSKDHTFLKNPAHLPLPFLSNRLQKQFPPTSKVKPVCLRLFGFFKKMDMTLGKLRDYLYGYTITTMKFHIPLSKLNQLCLLNESVTPNDMITAHIWKSLELPNPSRLFLACNLRYRFTSHNILREVKYDNKEGGEHDKKESIKEIQEGFWFGNFVLHAMTHSLKTQNESVSELANAIRQAIKQVRDRSEQDIQWLNGLSPSKLSQVGRETQLYSLMGNEDVSVSNWKFDIYKISFGDSSGERGSGGGKCIYFHQNVIPSFKNTAIILPGPLDVGGVEIYLNMNGTSSHKAKIAENMLRI